MTPHLRFELHDTVGVLRLDRPKANAIDIGFAEELAGAFGELRTRTDHRALVVTGTGSVFCAGLDLKAIPDYAPADQRRLILTLNRLLLELYGFPRPVVAAANGHAIAGGMVLLLASDYRVGTDDLEARFGLSEVRVGVAFPLGALEIVRTELAAPAARRMMLTGRTVAPQTALAEGALDELVPGDRCLERAVEVATGLGEHPERSYGSIKRQLRGGALDRIRASVDAEDDPVIDGWMGGGASDSARDVLRGR